jgi:hypothetical protein
MMPAPINVVGRPVTEGPNANIDDATRLRAQAFLRMNGLIP